MLIEEFIEVSNRAGSVDVLFKCYEKAMESVGFNRVLMALMNDHPALKKEAEHGVVKNYPDDWVRYYLEQGYDSIDPVRSSAFTKTEIYTWNALIQESDLNKKQLKMFNQAAEAGLHCGIGVPLHGANGAVAAMGAASTEKNIDITPFVLDKVHLLTTQFYVCFWRLMEKNPVTHTPKLTPKQQEVLKWSAKGCTKADIGEKLKMSEHTVDYHVRHSMTKLNSNNITATVAKAINRGLIQL